MRLKNPKQIIKFLFSFTGLILLANVLAVADGIIVADAWVREAPPGAHALAGYVKISNVGKEAVYLEGASSESFGMSMLHMSKMDKKKSITMHHMDKIHIPAGESVQLKPDGIHIMLMRPQREYKAGDTVIITLKFNGGLSKKTKFSVVRK